MRERGHVGSALVVLWTLIPQASAHADDGAASIRAVRVNGLEVRLDGRLDEPVWRQAVPARGFRQREPQEGAAATEDTEVRVVYDGRSLYVGILARDREPARIIARILQRDRVMEPQGFDLRHDFAGDDAVAILLDPFRDRRNAVVFATNPNGAEFDALITDETASFNADWRGVWSVRARRTEEGWSAEFEIPFRTLRYPQGDERPWGFNVYRIVRRKNEQTLWTGWAREGGGFSRVSRAGTLEGLAGLPRSGLNLEVKPFGLVGAIGDGPTLEAEAEADLGLDAKWEVRPGLVLDAAVNPDFAQVEADAEQVNLTRFDLFFPEKRDFFLENAGIFDFGFRGFGEPPPFLLFFSRRIGIHDEREVPVLGGLRLSGRAGRQTLGFLDMVTGPAFGEPRTNYGVLRVKRDVARSHYVGAMVADRRSREASNTALGLDGSFWPRPDLNLQAFFVHTLTSGPGGEGNAWRASLDYTGDRFGLVAQHLAVDPGLNAEVGFVTRTDIRRSDVFGRWTLRPRLAGLRKIDLFFGGQYVSRTDGETQDSGMGPFVGFEWDSGETLFLFAGRGFLRLDEGFDLSDRVPVPPGDYELRHWGFFAGTSRNRPVVLAGQGFFQRVFDGRIDTVGVTASASPGSHLSLTAGFTHNVAELPGGSFTANLASLRVGWAFSTRLVASAFVQYNSLERKVVTNLRLNFIHRPGSDLYVVFDEERREDGTWMTPARRAFAVKLTYLMRR